MNKKEFLTELEARLFGLPQDEIRERLTFYNEMIDDRMEEGLSEEEAVSGIGSVEEIVSQIVAEVPFGKLVKEKVKPKRALKGWEILLLILGCPIWLSLLIAAASVVFAAYAVVWSLIASLWAVEASFVVSSLVGVFGFFVLLFRGNFIAGIAAVGLTAFCAGASILLFFGCKQASKYMIRLMKKVALGIKSLFVGREDIK